MNKLNLILLALLMAAGAARAQLPLPAERAADPAQTMVLDAARAGARVVGVGEHGHIVLSDDGGRTVRQAQRVPANQTLTAVSFADARLGWAVGHGGVILHTTDGGEHWDLQRYEAAVDRPLLSVYFRDAQHGWAAGLWSLLLVTSDGGKEWRPVTLPAPPGAARADLNLLKVFGAGDGTLFIAAERGVVLKSTDVGSSWRYLETGSKASLWSGTALDDRTLLVGGLGGRLLRSADGGASWTVVPAAMTGSITQLRADAGQVWAASMDGKLWRSSDQGRSWQVAGSAEAPLTAIVKGEGEHWLRFARTGLLKGLPSRASPP